jgi:hypothetical protein
MRSLRSRGLTHHVMETLAQELGDGTGFAVADGPAIALDDGSDFGGGTCEEAFVGAVDVVARECHLLHFNLGRAGQFDDGVARDAFENAGDEMRRAKDAVFDKKNVVGRAFRHFTVVIEHNRFQAAGADCLDLGENIIEIIERFNASIQRVGMIADNRRRDDAQPFFVELGRIKGDVIDDDDDLRIGAAPRIESKIARAARHDQPNVAVDFGVCLHRVENGLRRLLAAEGNFQCDVAGTFVKTLNVLAQTEGFAAVNANALEDAVAVKQAVIEDAHFGVRFVEQFSVDPDLAHGVPRGRSAVSSPFPWRGRCRR